MFVRLFVKILHFYLFIVKLPFYFILKMLASKMLPSKVFNNLKQSLVNKVAHQQQLIWQTGTKIAGTALQHTPHVVPSWFDKAAFEHAQSLHETYSFV